MRKPISIVFLLFIFSNMSCEKDGRLRENPKTAKELRNTSDTMVIDGRAYYITNFIYRDFMPGREPGGSPLICITELHVKDQNPMPLDIELKKVSVVKGDEIWTMRFGKSENAGTYYIGSVRNGPKWTTGILVDIICEFKLGDKTFVVKAVDQPIKSTS